MRNQRQKLNTLVNAEAKALAQDMQTLEEKVRRVYKQGMTFVNMFCAHVDKYLARLATQRHVVTQLLDRIRPVVSADVLKQAKELRAVTLAQQQRWYEAQDELDDLQDSVVRRQKRNARRGIQIPIDQVKTLSSNRYCHWLFHIRVSYGIDVPIMIPRRSP